MLDEAGVPVAVRRAGALARIIASIRTSLPVNGHEYRVDYEPGESTTGALRRQLELARAGVVSGELSC